MKFQKPVALVAMLLLIVGVAAHALAAGYLVNTKSGKYHYANCRTIKHPNAAHFVPYNSREEAEADGYTPCGVCFR